jgi:hypothetical protein
VRYGGLGLAKCPTVDHEKNSTYRFAGPLKRTVSQSYLWQDHGLIGLRAR